MGLGLHTNIAKHTPGGVQHDQGLHGSWSDGSAQDDPAKGAFATNTSASAKGWRGEELTRQEKTNLEDLSYSLRQGSDPAFKEAKGQYITHGVDWNEWYMGGDAPPVEFDIEAADKALQQAVSTPIGRDLDLFRGAGSFDLGIEKSSEFYVGRDPQSLVGTVIGHEGFMSTSIDPTVASHFATHDVDDIEYPYVLNIKAKATDTGTYMEGAGIEGEMEMLLPPGTGVRITAVTMDNGTLWLDGEIE